jgi:hypothetical protein
MVRRVVWLVLLPLVMGQAPGQSPGRSRGSDVASDPTRPKKERLLAIYLGEAEGYTIYRDASKKEKVELLREPVYVWGNLVRDTQDGAVYVWTCRGRPEVVATFFSYPQVGPRKLHHELHSLATTVLDVTRPNEPYWKPEAPGVDFSPLPDAPAPARTASQRLIQMRALSREFSASSLDKQEKRWELRLLPQPLFRDQSTDPDVLDGALFTFVTSAGTDPEVMLLIEARRKNAGEPHSWQYAIGRFSDLQLWVRHKGKEVATFADMPIGQIQQDPKYRYHSFKERQIPPVEDPRP